MLKASITVRSASFFKIGDNMANLVAHCVKFFTPDYYRMLYQLQTAQDIGERMMTPKSAEELALWDQTPSPLLEPLKKAAQLAGKNPALKQTVFKAAVKALILPLQSHEKVVALAKFANGLITTAEEKSELRSLCGLTAVEGVSNVYTGHFVAARRKMEAALDRLAGRLEKKQDSRTYEALCLRLVDLSQPPSITRRRHVTFERVLAFCDRHPDMLAVLHRQKPEFFFLAAEQARNHDIVPIYQFLHARSAHNPEFVPLRRVIARAILNCRAFPNDSALMQEVHMDAARLASTNPDYKPTFVAHSFNLLADRLAYSDCALASTIMKRVNALCLGALKPGAQLAGREFFISSQLSSEPTDRYFSVNPGPVIYPREASQLDAYRIVMRHPMDEAREAKDILPIFLGAAPKPAERTAALALKAAYHALNGNISVLHAFAILCAQTGTEEGIKLGRDLHALSPEGKRKAASGVASAPAYVAA